MGTQIANDNDSFTAWKIIHFLDRQKNKESIAYENVDEKEREENY